MLISPWAVYEIDISRASAILWAMKKGAQSIEIFGHQPGLDGIRGIAITGVMLLHFLKTEAPQNMIEKISVKMAAYGVWGVDLFFVLSGFLITGILLDSKNKPKFFLNFYMRRTLRIFPLYFAVLALLVFLIPIAFPEVPLLEEAQEKQVWLWTYTANFLIASTGEWSLGPVSHFWSLAVEEHFYLFWPFVVFFTRQNMMERVCVAVIVGALALRLYLVFQGLSETSIGVLTPCRIDSMCAGGLFASLIRHPDSAKNLLKHAKWAVLIFAGGVVAVATWNSVVGIGVAYTHQFRVSLLAVMFAFFCLLGLQHKWSPTWLRQFLQNRILRFFGKYSYGLYVYHGIFTWYLQDNFIDWLTPYVGHHTVALLVKMIFGFTLSLIIAWASFEFFEKRFLSLKRFFEFKNQ